MLASKGKARLAVIEGDADPPACFLVARLATWTQLPGMLVIFLVTSHTSGLELLGDALAVARGALDLAMRPAQGKARLAIVVELGS